MISFKPLAWRVEASGRVCVSAFGIKTFFWLEGRPYDWSLWTLGETAYVETPGYQSQAAAKAAAQVDFNRRVLASIEGGM